MNFCTNCGNKLEDNSKFCTNCGKEIKKEVVKTAPKKIEKKEFNVNNLVLYVGVSLVILATFIFAICTWENMTGLFKISFLTFETLLFFMISFTFAKIKNNGLSKAFYLMAILMIPVILYTIPKYSLLGDYLSYEGAGIFVYLAISNFLCACIYLMSYLLLKTKAYTYISYVFIYAFITCIFLSIEKSLVFTILAGLVFVLLTIIFNFIDRRDSYFKKSITRFTSIIFSIFSVYMIFALNVAFKVDLIKTFGSINVYLILIVVLFLVNNFIFIYQNRKEFYTYFSPFIIMPMLLSMLAAFVKDDKIYMCLFAASALIIYSIYLIFRHKYLKITTKIVTYISLCSVTFIALCCAIADPDYYVVLAITSLIFLGFTILNRFTENFKWVSDILIPLAGFLTVFGIMYSFTSVPKIFTFLIVSSIYLVLYMLLKALNKKINVIYYIYAFITLIISMLMCTHGTDSIYIIFLNVLLVILFLYVSFVEKSSLLNIFTFIVLAISLLKIQLLIDVDLRIIISCIALISISVGIILKSKKPILSKFYLFFGEIISLILSLTVGAQTPYIVITLISVLFAVNFISICLYNNYNPFRIIAEIIGLILIYLVVHALIDVTVISSLITAFIYMVVLVILALTRKEKGWIIIILSLSCLIPYYDFVFHAGDLIVSYSEIINQLSIIPFIAYLFIFTFYFRMKDEVRMHVILWPLIALSTFTISSSTVGIIISLTLGLIYIFIGIIKKYKFLVAFGIIYMLATIVFEIYRMFNNLAILIAVLAIGLILILYVVINEVYKSKKNK